MKDVYAALYLLLLLASASAGTFRLAASAATVAAGGRNGAACSRPGLVAAAVAAPAAAIGGCDCGWGLCGSCCCWRSLRPLLWLAVGALLLAGMRLRLLSLRLEAAVRRLRQRLLRRDDCGCQCCGPCGCGGFGQLLLGRRRGTAVGAMRIQ